MSSPIEDQIDALLAQIADALAAGDNNQLQILMAQLAFLQEGGADLSGGVVHDFLQTHNLRLCPVAPHGDQCVQQSVWKARSVCGRCSAVPRYWQLSFDFNPIYNDGLDYDHYFGPAGIVREYKHWFEDIVLKRGPMIREPFAPPGDDLSGNYAEASQARFEVEYTYAYWKRRTPPESRYQPGNVLANGLNVAWFLFYGEEPTGGEAPGPVDEPDYDSDNNWNLMIVENTRLKPTGSGTAWTNSYSPLLTYRLVPRYREAYEDDALDDPRKTRFECLGANEFEVVENYLNLPKHLLTMKPFYP